MNIFKMFISRDKIEGGDPLSMAGSHLDSLGLRETPQEAPQEASRRHPRHPGLQKRLGTAIGTANGGNFEGPV